jgi:autotransporter-associated beta strand protein
VQQIANGVGSVTTNLQLDGTATDNLISGNILNSADGSPRALSVSKAGSSTWTLSGTNTYSGGTTVTAGTLSANAAGALSTGNVTVTAGTLIIDVANAMADTAALSLPSATAKNITMNANDTVGSLLLAGVQQPNNTYTSSGLGSAWMNAGAGILTVGSAAVQPMYWDLNDANAGACVGGGNTAAGTWDGAAANWNDVADGTGTTTAWSQGRTAAFSAGTDATGTYAVTVDGTRDIGGLTFEEGNVTLSGGTALRMTSNSLAYVNTGLTATISTPISQDATARSFTKGGPGTLILAAANSYAGATTLNQGTLRLTDTGALAASSSMSVANGTTLELRSDTAATFTTPLCTLTSGATTTIDVNNNGSGSGNTLTLSGGIATPTNVTTKINVTGGNGYTLSIPTVAQIAGTLTFNPTTANLNLGTVTINCIGDASFILDGTTTGNTVTSITDIGVISNLSYMTKQGTGTWTAGNITTTKGMVITAGKLIVNGTLWQNKNDRSITLSGASTELHLNNAAAVRNQPSATVKALVISGGKLDNSSGAAITTSTYNPTMGWNGDFTFIGSNGAASNLYLGTGAVAMNATRQVTVQNAATTLTVGGIISGTGFGLTKAGDGTLALSGANAYTGPTAINQGTLLVNSPGSLNAASLVTVNSTGTLGGTGTINGAVTVNDGGTLAPGASAGTLTVNNSLAMGSGSTYVWQLGSGGLADLVDVNGTLSIASSWTLKLMSDGGTPGTGEYNLFTYDAFSGSFTLPTIDATGTWTTAKVAQDTVKNRIYLSFGLPGDTNGDFVVDAADFITLKKNFGAGPGATGKEAIGDFNDSGTVNWADLNILTNAMAGTGGAPAVTPEPATLGLLMVGALAVLRRRRK